VLGCHIEMSTTPGRDYPIGARRQPDEPPLQMTVDQLRAVRRAAHKAARTPGVHVFDDFVIFNGTGRMATVTLLARSLRQRLGRPRLR
jgi:hydroxyacylglutathione hydrolase